MKIINACGPSGGKNARDCKLALEVKYKLLNWTIEIWIAILLSFEVFSLYPRLSIGPGSRCIKDTFFYSDQNAFKFSALQLLHVQKGHLFQKGSS